MKHARKVEKPKRQFPLTAVVLILVLCAGGISIGVFHNYLTHKGITVQWDKGKKLQPAPTAKCSSGWLWRPTTSTWVCNKP